MLTFSRLFCAQQLYDPLSDTIVPYYALTCNININEAITTRLL